MAGVAQTDGAQELVGDELRAGPDTPPGGAR